MKLEELGRLLREKDPSAVLAPQRVIARVVQNVLGLSWATWRIPHTQCFLVNRGTLFKFVEQEELVIPSDYMPPDTAVLLLERPTDSQLTGRRNDLLTRYWRLLFHVSLHRELESGLTGVNPAGLRERIEQLGPAAFEEARNVLVHDGLLSPKADDRTAYIEFASYYLELRFFAPNLIPVCFPSLPHADDVDLVLAPDVDGVAVFRQTRLEGAPDPAPKTDDQSDESHDFYRSLSRAAGRAAKAGDTVAAAIMHTRAARVAPASFTLRAQADAREDIYRLIDRLQAALALTSDEVTVWRQVLPTLLDKADQGARPVEASLLYDLQRACMDHEQTIYTLDVAEWVLSAGKKPIKRPLQSQEFVRIPAQLRTAIRRLAAARLADADRQTLGSLFRDALDRAEERLRQQFRPVLTEALRDAGLQPTSLPEQAALSKTVEELLDRISAAGFLGFADVRDAIARGQMKLQDLDGAQEMLSGDQLLRLDRRLATLLDGVYRRAESYTRALERVTAFNFGTRAGRWLTRNITLPFGGALLVAQFIWMLVLKGRTEAARKAGETPPTFFGGWNESWWFHLGWVLGGVFLLLAIRVDAVRSALNVVGRAAYRAARYMFIDLPIRLGNSKIVRAVLASVPAQVAINYGLKPFVLTAVILLAFPDLWRVGVPAWVITFVACAFFINSRLGRAAEALTLEALKSLGELIRSFPAVLRWINDLFKEMIAALEWVLARGEDWLRLRGSSGPFAIVVRVVAGLIWMPFAFLIRFYTVVLIEPMVNPLKLPLSLLFAKVVYPLLLMMPGILVEDNSLLGYRSPLADELAQYLTKPGAWVLIMGTIWLLPDACTYLFWEMRENWRLYRANRPAALGSVMVGSHGETMPGLLYWGFHSGTVPKLYSRLRWAEQQAAVSEPPNWRDARTYRAALRGVEEAVRRFVTRELTEILNHPLAGWGGPRLRVGQVTLGTNRIRLELVPEPREPAAQPDEGSEEVSHVAGRSAWVEWEDRSGWLVVGWVETGFLTELTTEQARTMKNCVAYLYKRAGVDLVREQLRAELPKDAAHFDVAAAGLLVWYGSREAAPVLYELGDPGADLHPRNPEDLRPVPGLVLDADRLVFGRVQLTWDQWTQVWESAPASPTRPRFGPADHALALLLPANEPTDEVPPLLTPPPVEEPKHVDPAADGSAVADTPTDRNGTPPRLHPESNGSVDGQPHPPSVS